MGLLQKGEEGTSDAVLWQSRLFTVPCLFQELSVTVPGGG